MKELESHMRGETQTERLAKMRHRAKELTRKREDERLKIVEEKSEQRWRGECEGEIKAFSNYFGFCSSGLGLKNEK